MLTYGFYDSINHVVLGRQGTDRGQRRKRAFDSDLTSKLSSTVWSPLSCTSHGRLGVRTVTIQRERPGQSAQIPSKVRSRRTLELRAAGLELVAKA